uniref:Endolysin n=1 Tax=Pectobacterium phage Koroua TaxID=3158138 RepID=A0AB39ABP6_9CAUD
MLRKLKMTGGIIGVAAAALLATSLPEKEGMVLTTYPDIVGKPTVCAGHTGEFAIAGKTYTTSQCWDILDKDVAKHAVPVIKCSPWLLNTNPYFIQAAIDHAFQFGPNKWCTSEAKKYGQSGDYKKMCLLFSQTLTGGINWSQAGGKYSRGVHNRSKWRTETCRKGL